MIKRIAVLIVISVLSLGTPVLAAETGNGTIEGQLVNGTDNGSSVGSQEVTLRTYLDGNETASATTGSDEEGHFVFDSLPTAPGYTYEVVLTFQGAEYYSKRLSFSEEETSRSAEVIVYDSTTSDSAIRIAMSHTIIYLEQDTLLVKEYFLFVNEADRTYIGSEEVDAEGTRETLRFPLPGEATGLQIEYGLMECCIYNTRNGFIDTMPVLPGGKEIIYSYRVNYDSGGYTFTRNSNYPMTRYDFLYQGEGIEATSIQLKTEEPLNIEGTRFNHLSGGNFGTDETLAVKMSGLPQDNTQRMVLWVALALGVLAGGFGFSYLFRRRRVQPVKPQMSPDQERQKLLVELAQLDDDFEGNKIPEDAYRSLRARNKARLVELVKRLTDKGG